MNVYVPLCEYVELINWYQVFLPFSLTFLSQVLSLTDEADWSPALGPPISVSQYKVTDTNHHPGLFTSIWAPELRPSCMCNEHLTIFAAPAVTVYKWSKLLNNLGLMKTRKILLIIGICLMNSWFSEFIFHLKCIANYILELITKYRLPYFLFRPLHATLKWTVWTGSRSRIQNLLPPEPTRVSSPVTMSALLCPSVAVLKFFSVYYSIPLV